MPLTPEDVRNRRFKTAFRGYDEEEVDTFLDEVEVELSRLLSDNDGLRQRLETVQAAPPPQPVTSEAEEMLRRTLLLAQRTADETVAGAQAEAERITGEARALAAQTVQAAEQQAAASIGDLERRRQELEQHIEGLRAFEREYRTRLKAYLESQLRDLDGRAQPDAPTMPPAPAAGTPAPAAVPGSMSGSIPGSMPGAVPGAGPGAVPPAVPTPAVPAAGGVPSFASAPMTSVSSVPPAAPEAADEPSAEGDPEPFDIDDGDGGVPRLAP
ncbi:MAG TPA: DivIVA domain-containing protein [Mycobacteriales bacterium]|nr:DivIVA domain-containing protein [Mycobacteriales bacterium]